MNDFLIGVSVFETQNIEFSFAKTHHYIILFVDHYIVVVDQVQTNFMVGLWCYNQSGVTELLIMRDPHYHPLWTCHADTLPNMMSCVILSLTWCHA